MRQFVKELLPWRFVEEGEEPETQGLKTVLTLLDGGVEGAWGGRCRLGWYREFVRHVSGMQRGYRRGAILTVV